VETPIAAGAESQNCFHSADRRESGKRSGAVVPVAGRVRLGWLSSASGRLGVLTLDRVTERRRAAQLARHYRDQEGLAIAEIARQLGRAQATIKSYLYDPTGDNARQVKARYRRVCRGCGAPTAPRNGKGDAYAYCNAAIPARSRRNGHGNGFAKQCAHGERATALSRPPTPGRAPTHADAAAKRSNDYKPEDGPRRPLSSTCTGAGRRPSPTPSAAPERSGVNAADIRTRAGAWPSLNGSAEGRRDASAIRPSGRRDAASPRSSVSSGRLYGVHNSGITGGRGHAVGATIAIVA
jgi:hypothetical protein